MLFRISMEASVPPAGTPEALRDIDQRAIEVDRLRP